MSKTRYSEIFSSPDRKSERTFLVADLVGSKDLARSGVSYDDYLKNAVQFFDICDEHLSNHGAERIRLDGDSVKAAFDPDQAHMAVKAAIAIHKSSRGLPHPTLAAVGIATGSVVDVDDDYASMVTISARHLALAGSPLSILICLNTAQRIGAGSHFTTDAIGDRQAVLLPIAAKPVEYHEVKWDKIRYGLKSRAVTQGLSSLSK